MRLGWNDMKLTALVSVLGLSIWTIGCGEPASPDKPISPVKATGGEAGSTKGGGTDVPAAPEGDTGATKPTEEKKVDEKSPEGEQAKKEEAPAAKKEDEKKE